MSVLANDALDLHELGNGGVATGALSCGKQFDLLVATSDTSNRILLRGIA